MDKIAVYLSSLNIPKSIIEQAKNTTFNLEKEILKENLEEIVFKELNNSLVGKEQKEEKIKRIIEKIVDKYLTKLDRAKISEYADDIKNEKFNKKDIIDYTNKYIQRYRIISERKKIIEEKIRKKREVIKKTSFVKILDKYDGYIGTEFTIKDEIKKLFYEKEKLGINSKLELEASIKEKIFEKIELLCESECNEREKDLAFGYLNMLQELIRDMNINISYSTGELKWFSSIVRRDLFKYIEQNYHVPDFAATQLTFSDLV